MNDQVSDGRDQILTVNPPNPDRYKILLAIMLGIAMAPIDASMVNVILPILVEDFKTDIAVAQWVPLIYLLIISSLLLFFGRLGDTWGHRKIFLAGLIGFIGASVLCGLSPGIYWLIAFRAIQALAAAMLMAVPLAIITASFPNNELGRALGTYAISISAGLAFGPSFGGLIASLFGWRFSFFINIPIGLMGFVYGSKVIPKSDGKPGKHDILGALLSFISLFFLLLFINHTQNSGLTLITIAMAVVAFTSGIGFFLLEQRTTEPMLNLGLFRIRNFLFASLSAFFNFMAQYVVVFLMPFYLHRVLRLPPNKVGLIMSCFPLAVMSVAPLSGWLSDRMGTRLLSSVGALVCVLALVLMSLLPTSAPPFNVVILLALFGLGTGVFQSPNTSSAMGSVPREYLGISSAVIANVRNIGMAFGIALAVAMLHVYVPEYVLKEHFLTSSETGLFFSGLKHAFLAGAIAACFCALASLFKKSRSKNVL